MNRQAHIEKLRFYAETPRASARKIHQIVEGDFKAFWLAQLRGKAVALKQGQHKFEQRDEAVQHAKDFRESCRRELAMLTAEEA